MEGMAQADTARAGNAEERPRRRVGLVFHYCVKQNGGRTDGWPQDFWRDRFGLIGFFLVWLHKRTVCWASRHPERGCLCVVRSLPLQRLELVELREIITEPRSPGRALHLVTVTKFRPGSGHLRQPHGFPDPPA